jgi:class 3 adenylate cyclase
MALSRVGTVRRASASLASPRRWELIGVRSVTGTVTFLFTDIEDSARRWEEQPSAMSVTLARRDSCYVRR